MLVADTYVGNSDEAPMAATLAETDPLAVTLDDTERRRSRVRTTAEDGTDLGIVVGRELRDGDVLEAKGRLVVVSLAPIEVLVVDFSGVAGSTAATLAALALGHATGNRHWDLAVDGDRALLPLAERRERMEAEIDPHLPDGATVTSDEVSPALFGDEDGGLGDGHEHAHGSDDHAHEHDGHAHGDGRTGGHTHGDHTHGVREIDPEGQS